MKSFIRTVVVTIIIGVFLTSCSAKEDTTVTTTSVKTDSDTKMIGVVLPTEDKERWVQDEAYFKELMEESDYDVEVVFSQSSSAVEKENVENLINKGADVIVICAQDCAGAAVETAKEANVPVISYDRLVTDTDTVDYYVTFDSYSIGKAQAEYLVSSFEGQKSVPLYLYAGDSKDNNTFILFESAWETLQPKIEDGTFVIANSSKANELKNKAELSREEQEKIVGQITTYNDPKEARKKAEAHLKAAGHDLEGDVAILASNDNDARAIAKVFETNRDIDSYVVTGQDAEKTSIQYILDGKQSMTVFKDIRALTKDTLDVAIALIEGRTPETTVVYNNGVIDVPARQLDVVVVTKDNVKKELFDSGYYDETTFVGSAE